MNIFQNYFNLIFSDPQRAKQAVTKRVLGSIVRNRSSFIPWGRIKNKEYLEVGPGPVTNEDFVTMDYYPYSHIDVCWDITKAYPFKDNTFKGIYTEHCLEHITFEDFKHNIKEFFRILKPGGVVRIIMPDGEIYFDIYQKRKNGENIQMPYEDGYISPMQRINGIFREHGHKFIHDFYTMRIILEEAGFKNIKKEKFRQGRDPKLLRDLEIRAHESLYVEAEK